jgi:hypothetical protein
MPQGGVRGTNPVGYSGIFNVMDYFSRNYILSVEFKIWGAGGGGSADNVGGAGAYVYGKYNILPGTAVKAVVGQGGLNNPSLGVRVYGGGGHKGTTYNYNVGTGGGQSGIYVTQDTIFSGGDPQSGATVDNAILIASGGGGAGWNTRGGAGGIVLGQNGVNNSSTGGTGAVWDGAGTNTGSPGGGGGAGFFMLGGHSSGGGGGGGGLYGGGAGNNGGAVSSGAGGASYYKTSQTFPSGFVFGGQATGIAGIGQVTGNNNDSLNNGVYGGGGGTTSNGQNGLIAYRIDEGVWQTIEFSGADQEIIF